MGVEIIISLQVKDVRVSEQGAEENIWTLRNTVTAGRRQLHNKELHD
jgi:hypothetical protein